MQTLLTWLSQLADRIDAHRKPIGHCWCGAPTPGGSWCSPQCLADFEDYERNIL